MTKQQVIGTSVAVMALAVVMSAAVPALASNKLIFEDNFTGGTDGDALTGRVAPTGQTWIAGESWLPGGSMITGYVGNPYDTCCGAGNFGTTAYQWYGNNVNLGTSLAGRYSFEIDMNRGYPLGAGGATYNNTLGLYLREGDAGGANISVGWGNHSASNLSLEGGAGVTMGTVPDSSPNFWAGILKLVVDLDLPGKTVEVSWSPDPAIASSIYVGGVATPGAPTSGTTGPISFTGSFNPSQVALYLQTTASASVRDGFDNLRLVQIVPEPGSLSLLGIAGLLGLRHRRRA